MSEEAIIKDAIQAMLDTDEEKAVEVANRALSEGADPVKVLTEGFSVGIREIGDLFSRGEVFMPEMILAAEAMKAAVEVLDKAIEGKDAFTFTKPRCCIRELDGVNILREVSSFDPVFEMLGSL